MIRRRQLCRRRTVVAGSEIDMPVYASPGHASNK